MKSCDTILDFNEDCFLIAIPVIICCLSCYYFIKIWSKEYKNFEHDEDYDSYSLDKNEIAHYLNIVLKEFFDYSDLDFFSDPQNFSNNYDMYVFLSRYCVNSFNVNCILNDCNVSVKNEIKNFIIFLTEDPSFVSYQNYKISEKAVIQIINTIKFNQINVLT